MEWTGGHRGDAERGVMLGRGVSEHRFTGTGGVRLLGAMQWVIALPSDLGSLA